MRAAGPRVTSAALRKGRTRDTEPPLNDRDPDRPVYGEIVPGLPSPEHPHERLAAFLPELTGYFLRRLSNRDDAADAAADTIVVLLEQRWKLPADSVELRRYAYGVARKILLQARRGRVRRTEIASRLRQELGDGLVRPHETDPDLAAALAGLPERERELLLLVAWEGFGVAEAGALLGLSPAAARKRYSRVRGRLRTDLA